MRVTPAIPHRPGRLPNRFRRRIPRRAGHGDRGHAGLARGRTLTAHPSVHGELREGGAEVSGGRVVRDGILLTSQGPGTAMEFALAVAAELAGQEVADDVARAMCV